MPVVCCAAPPAAIRQEKRSMRTQYSLSSEGDGRRTSKADKAAARQSYLKSAKTKKVPEAFWGMFKAYLGAEGEKSSKQEPTLADLIQLVIEGAGGVIDTTNWVAYHVSQHRSPPVLDHSHDKSL